MLSPEAQVWATVIAYVLLAVGCAGIIFPVLPGSMLNIGVLLGWALAVNSPAGWSALAAGGIASAIGVSASAVLTGKRLRDLEVPTRVVVIAGAAALIGLFALPGPGLLLGFVLGLFGAEWYRRRDVRAAGASTVGALKAVGLGLLVELGCAALAFLLFTGAVVWHFAAFH